MILPRGDQSITIGLHHQDAVDWPAVGCYLAAALLFKLAPIKDDLSISLLPSTSLHSAAADR